MKGISCKWGIISDLPPKAQNHSQQLIENIVFSTIFVRSRNKEAMGWQSSRPTVFKGRSVLLAWFEFVLLPANIKKGIQDLNLNEK